MAGPHTAEALRERWISLGLSTRAVDKAAAEKKIKAAYFHSGLDIPSRFLWFPSPMGALVAIAAMRCMKETALLVSPGIQHQIHNGIFQTAIGAIGADPERSKMSNSVLSEVRTQVHERVRARILGQISDQVHAGRDNMNHAFVRDKIGSSVFEWMMTPVREQVPGYEDWKEDLWWKIEDVIMSLSHCRWGWSEDYWLAAYECFIRGGKPGASAEALRRFQALVEIREHLTVFFPFADVVLCCENPLALERDERGRLHSSTGPAVMYRDGWGFWTWHGIRVSKQFIERPETITVTDIDAQENAEVRRIMIERMGWERYIKEARMRPVHSDDWGTLYKKHFLGDPEPLLLVRVTNSTPEPDGSHKDYVLRVHPECRPLLPGDILGDAQKLTALNAIASTFGLKGDEYVKVLVQT